jgi:hypothetical protein
MMDFHLPVLMREAGKCTHPLPLPIFVYIAGHKELSNQQLTLTNPPGKDPN